MKQPEQSTFFIDRSLGRYVIAERLREAGARVEIHDDHFAQDAPDEVWLSEVGRRGWVVLTKDRGFQRRDLEIAAIARAAVRVFQLTAGNVGGPEMAEILTKSLKKITAIATGNHPPFIARVTKGGKVSIAFNRTKLRRWVKR